jgi:hypothetical protein
MKNILWLLMLVCFNGWAQQKPNIIIIFEDHTYQAMSAYGNKLTHGI